MLLLSIFFHVLHVSVIALNIFGWAFPRLRRWALACQAITLICWVGFGLLKGWWGFCPLTYWHWEVLRELGAGELPSNYISYIALYWFNLPLSDDFAAGLILGCFSMAVLINLKLLSTKKVSM
jgi:hypothetical protein